MCVFVWMLCGTENPPGFQRMTAGTLAARLSFMDYESERTELLRCRENESSFVDVVDDDDDNDDDGLD